MMKGLNFIIFLILISIFGVVGTTFLSKIDSYNKRLVEDDFSQGEFDAFTTSLEEGAALIRDTLLSTKEEDISKEEAELKDLQEKANQVLEEMKKNCKTEEELDYLVRIEQRLLEYWTLYDEIIKLRKENQKEAALFLFEKEAEPVLLQIMSYCDTLTAYYSETVERKVSKSYQTKMQPLFVFLFNCNLH